MFQLVPYRVSKFAVENVFNSNATIVVLNSTKTTAINDNEKNLAKNEENPCSNLQYKIYFLADLE